MAIYVNGIKVAGRGVSGKSPYQVALGEGYTGTEADFNAQLAAIGEAARGFDELSREVESAKEEIETAIQQVDTVVSQALTNINNAKADIAQTVETAIAEIDTKVANAKNEIDVKVANALASIPDSENLVTKQFLEERLETVEVDLTGYATENYVNTAITGMATQTWVTNQINTMASSIVTDVWYVGSTEPDQNKTGEAATKARKLLWIDTTASTGGLKYYNGSAWVHVPVAWT